MARSGGTSLRQRRRKSKVKSLEELKNYKTSLGYKDIYERTKEYFKAPGVFRLLKGQWNYLYPEKEGGKVDG